jgi:hypothetical protein
MRTLPMLRFPGSDVATLLTAGFIQGAGAILAMVVREGFRNGSKSAAYLVTFDA